MGEAIRESIAAGKVTREEVFLTTKVFSNSYGPGRVLSCVERMLAEAGVDYFDLVLLHWPFVFVDDDKQFTPLDSNGQARRGTRPLVEVYQELEKVYERKWARSIGVSNFNRRQLDDILAVAKVPPSTNQVECHPYLQQRKLQAYCSKHNIHLTAYCPLGRAGIVVGRPDVPNVLLEPVLLSIGAKYGKTTAQVILRWLMDRGLIVIPKSVHRHRIVENFDVFDFQLSDEERAQIDALDRGFRLVLFGSYGCPSHPEYPFADEF